MTVDSVRERALALPELARADLAADLLASLGPDVDDDEVLGAWAAELERRAHRLDSGADRAVPLDEALEHARTNLAK